MASLSFFVSKAVLPFDSSSLHSPTSPLVGTTAALTEDLGRSATPWSAGHWQAPLASAAKAHSAAAKLRAEASGTARENRILFLLRDETTSGFECDKLAQFRCARARVLGLFCDTEGPKCDSRSPALECSPDFGPPDGRLS